MSRLTILFLLALAPLAAAEKGWTTLFNGQDFSGWKVNENQETFTIKDGAIVTKGKTAHCFYVGDFQNHSFTNYELKVDVMTEPNSNGGIYVDTEYQEHGWPAKGFEIQVNNSYTKDPRKTASIYQVKDNPNEVAKDGEYFTERIVVKGKTITTYVNNKKIVSWTQPADWTGTKDFKGREIAPGTIALQAHDPNSVVHYKNIRIKPLK